MTEVHTAYGRAIYIVGGVFLTGIGAVALLGHHHGGTVASEWAALVVLVLGLVLVCRGPRLGLEFDDTQLTTRGPLMTRTFDRDGARVEFTPWKVGAAVPRLRSGNRAIPLYGLTTSPGRASKDALAVLSPRPGWCDVAPAEPEAGSLALLVSPITCRAESVFRWSHMLVAWFCTAGMSMRAR